MHDKVSCSWCGEPIDSHWLALLHTDCSPGRGPLALRKAEWEDFQRRAELMHQGFLRKLAKRRAEKAGVFLRHATDRED